MFVKHEQVKQESKNDNYRGFTMKDRRQSVHMIWNEETIGITDADRAYHLKWHYFGSLCLSLMCGLLGYSIYLTKTEDDDL